MEDIAVKRWLAFMIALMLVGIGASSCASHPSSSSLSVQKLDVEKTVDIDSGDAEKILALFEEGDWIEKAPNCIHDFVFNDNGDVYRYHSACGKFYSITEERSLKLNESSRAEVNDILEALFD
jgi:hypothetical protein